MSDSTKAEQAEKSNGLSIAKETNSNDSLNEILAIETLEEPIDLIQTNTGWFVGMGRTRLSEHYKTKEEAMQFTETVKFVINLIIVITEQVKQIETAKP